MKRLSLILIAFLLPIFAYSADYEPEHVFSKVSVGNISTVAEENYKRWFIEQSVIGFPDGTKVAGKTWTVETRIGLGGTVPAGWVLHSSELYYSATQTITFNANGTYTTSMHSLYVPPYTGPDSGKWMIEGNQFIIMSAADLVNGLRSYRNPINKENDYKWNTTVAKRQAGLYFSLPEDPPLIPTNLTATAAITQATGKLLSISETVYNSTLSWTDKSTDEGGFHIWHRKDTLDTETGFWTEGTWSTTPIEIASDTTSYAATMTGPGKHLFRIQSYKTVSSVIVYSPLGGSNTLQILTQ